jgi:hypothetical protein
MTNSKASMKLRPGSKVVNGNIHDLTNVSKW